jgi:DNA-binding GntR family transcriptional regulator
MPSSVASCSAASCRGSAAEGVVELSRHRGAYIRLLTRRQSLELMQVVEAVIALGVRLATLRMKETEHRAQLKIAFERLNDHGPTGDRVLQAMDRNGFYDAIFAIADNRELRRIHPVVPTQILRMQVYPYLSTEDRAQQFADYKLLYDAMRTGNSREASRIVVRHARRSRMQIKRLPDEAFASE